LWDGQNIVAEIGTTGSVTARYMRGINLITREQDGANQYYLFNTHWDVIQCANTWKITETSCIEVSGHNNKQNWRTALTRRFPHQLITTYRIKKASKCIDLEAFHIFICR